MADFELIVLTIYELIYTLFAFVNSLKGNTKPYVLVTYLAITIPMITSMVIIHNKKAFNSKFITFPKQFIIIILGYILYLNVIFDRLTSDDARQYQWNYGDLANQNMSFSNETTKNIAFNNVGNGVSHVLQGLLTIACFPFLYHMCKNKIVHTCGTIAVLISCWYPIFNTYYGISYESDDINNSEMLARGLEWCIGTLVAITIGMCITAYIVEKDGADNNYNVVDVATNNNKLQIAICYFVGTCLVITTMTISMILALSNKHLITGFIFAYFIIAFMILHFIYEFEFTRNIYEISLRYTLPPQTPEENRQIPPPYTNNEHNDEYIDIVTSSDQQVIESTA
jgi:hypothetical protein